MSRQNQQILIETDSLMTLTQVANYLGRPRVAVWRMSKRGELTTLRFGGRDLFFVRAEIEQLKERG
ncbi:MAG: hypothetical protein DDT38_01689 [Firmicutes bacterium]|nr:hypothetical protein [candidate division NPL-UPA2 bacterium]